MANGAVKDLRGQTHTYRMDTNNAVHLTPILNLYGHVQQRSVIIVPVPNLSGEKQAHLWGDVAHLAYVGLSV